MINRLEVSVPQSCDLGTQNWAISDHCCRVTCALPIWRVYGTGILEFFEAPVLNLPMALICAAGAQTRRDSPARCVYDRSPPRRRNMNIGEPLRTIIVEPLELPVEAPAVEPDPEPRPLEPEPEQEPAKV
jgi:hypothetical protein